MRRASQLAVVLVAVLIAVGPLRERVAAALPPSGYVVVFRDGVDPEAATARLEGRHGFVAGHRYVSALSGFSAQLSAAQLSAVAGDPDVAFHGADRIVVASGMVPLARGDRAPSGVRRIGAATTTQAHEAADVAVAVIDTGIDLGHRDLDAAAGTNCVARGAPPNDDHGHGTHVAGTIAARNDGAGVVGVAPGTRVYAVKVLNAQGAGTISQLICGLEWVARHGVPLGIRVASLSVGGPGTIDDATCATTTDALRKAVCSVTSAGVTLVVAAGNGATDLATTTPAAYPEVLTVSAMTDGDGLPRALEGPLGCRPVERPDSYARFSNFAVTEREQKHLISAPGVCVTSTWPGGAYQTISGTSMAAPHVSGTVALCFGSGGQRGPCAGLAPNAVIARIRADAESHATATNGFSGDPAHGVARRSYGYLVWAGGY
ncbi:MAG: S8 family serine peptidase [Chloroflexi bacterium]|nr:S8 family serine peptidase [Chloroflexota bacterium]